MVEDDELQREEKTEGAELIQRAGTGFLSV